MERMPKPSMQTRVLSFAFLLILTASFFLWFVISSYGLNSDIESDSAVIVFDKGVMYVLGGVLGLCGLLFAAVYQGILEKSLSKKGERVLTKLIIACIVIMFVFPHVVQYYVENIIERKTYQVCDEMIYKWLFYEKYYYTDTPETCRTLITEKGK
jgi:hypothetical protein